MALIHRRSGGKNIGIGNFPLVTHFPLVWLSEEKQRNFTIHSHLSHFFISLLKEQGQRHKLHNNNLILPLHMFNLYLTLDYAFLEFLCLLLFLWVKHPILQNSWVFTSYCFEHAILLLLFFSHILHFQNPVNQRAQHGLLLSRI